MSKEPPKLCTINGCQRFIEAKGLCDTHYRLARRSGKMPNSKPCTIAGCDKFVINRGLCLKHYKRMRLNGTTDDPVYPRWPNCPVWKSRQGYLFIKCSDHPNSKADGTILLHRYIMSEPLGRPLSKTETVHHKNGDRANNSLKKGHELGGCPSTCCNLELWSLNNGSQPAGQRIRDTVAVLPGDLWQESW